MQDELPQHRLTIVRVGFRCSGTCGFCRRGRGGGSRVPCSSDGSTVAAGGVRQLMISGGEPTVYSELLDLVRHARAAGLHTVAADNAIRMARSSPTTWSAPASTD